jgi:hypothetical protein
VLRIDGGLQRARPPTAIEQRSDLDGGPRRNRGRPAAQRAADPLAALGRDSNNVAAASARRGRVLQLSQWSGRQRQGWGGRGVPRYPGGSEQSESADGHGRYRKRTRAPKGVRNRAVPVPGQTHLPCPGTPALRVSWAARCRPTLPQRGRGWPGRAACGGGQ